MRTLQCPRCSSEENTKSGIIKGRQRYHCRSCGYYFSVLKAGKSLDPYYVVKALQLHLEGVTYREIERILGISHVTVLNWVRDHGLKKPVHHQYHPTYKVLSHNELKEFVADRKNLKAAGCMITELGDKFMVIQWERFRKNSLENHTF